MVICKFFLNGTCRFGENCKNEHSYNDNTGSVLRKKQDIDPNVIIKSVSNDMDKAENGNQWPFSCYGPFQGKPCFPGFEDKCFEEIRLGLYDAERNGTAEQYKQQLTQLINETRMKMRSLQNPTPEATNVLKGLYNSNQSDNQTTSTFANNSSIFANINNPSSQPSIFGNTHVASQNIFTAQPVASNFTFTLPENKSIFGNAANNQLSSGSIFTQNNQPSFSSTNSIFGGGQGKSMFAPTPNTNVFQTTPPNTNFTTNSGSIFGNQQNTQIFAQQPTTGASIFAQNNTPPNQANPFNRPQQTNDPPFNQNTNDLFKQNVFQQNMQQPPANQSPFAATSSFGQNSVLHSQNQVPGNTLAEHAKSIFGGSLQSQVGFPAQAQNNKHDDATIYSKLEDLSDKDIKCFEAAAFEFGKIPENPPTLQMC